MRFFRSFVSLFMLLAVSFVPTASALTIPPDIFVPAVLRDGSNNPITVAQDLRVSLWSQSTYKSGDVLGNGSINTGAQYYGGYQVETTVTPNGQGYFVPVTFGLVNVYPATLLSFPEINETNVYLQLEYKNQGAAVTQYQIYDFSGDANASTFVRHVLDPDLVNQAVNGGQSSIWESFIIGSNETGSSDLTLQFGSTLMETLKWNDAQNYFQLSDALVVDGNLNINGTIFRLDFDNTSGASADIDIVAEQGTNSDGILRYSAANERWEISNEGGSFLPILSGPNHPDISSVTDTSISSPTPGTNPNFGTEIEILTPTRPSLTPDDSSQRILISGAVQFTNPSGGDDTDATIRVRIRRGSGNCNGTQVGPDLTATVSDPLQSIWVPFTFVDSPSTSSSQSYTVCAALRDGNGSSSTNATTPTIMMTLQQIAP